MKVCQKCHEKFEESELTRYKTGEYNHLWICHKCEYRMWGIVELWLMGGSMVMPEVEIPYFEVLNDDTTAPETEKDQWCASLPE